ncbi:MAG: phospholipid/glycerol acyltransferase [Planctomycetota bacterium]|nr:phospholipid/glycerol acyltransferase [Planctomycetota bacterium]
MSHDKASPRIITAYKHGWPRRAVHGMIVRKIRNAFFRIRVQGIERLRTVIEAEPGGTLFLANHSCWWDLFLVHYLNEAIPVDGYGMMEHFNMLRFGFFRRIGAFSVDRTDPASVRASIDYAVGLLKGPRAGVWIFPQGRMIGNDVRPLGFQPGLRALVRRAGRVRIVPVAFRFEFWQDERPEAFVRFGEPAWVERRDVLTVVETWERRLTEELDALKIDVTSQAADHFTTIMQGPGSISDRYARFRARFRGNPPGAIDQGS